MTESKSRDKVRKAGKNKKNWNKEEEKIRTAEQNQKRKRETRIRKMLN